MLRYLLEDLEKIGNIINDSVSQAFEKFEKIGNDIYDFINYMQRKNQLSYRSFPKNPDIGSIDDKFFPTSYKFVYIVMEFYIFNYCKYQRDLEDFVHTKIMCLNGYFSSRTVRTPTYSF